MNERDAVRRVERVLVVAILFLALAWTVNLTLAVAGAKLNWCAFGVQTFGIVALWLGSFQWEKRFGN